jgi:hypothetical protein
MPHDTTDDDEIEDAPTDDTISRDAIDTLDTEGELSKRFDAPESDTDEEHRQRQGGADDE